MKIKYILLLALLGNLFVMPLFAQTEEAPQRWAVQVNVQHKDLAVKYSYGQLGVVYKVPVRPFYTIEGQRFFRIKDKSKKFLSLKAGLYNDLYHERWTSLQLGLGWERNLTKNLFLALRAEFGGASVRNTDIQYRYENG